MTKTLVDDPLSGVEETPVCTVTTILGLNEMSPLTVPVSSGISNGVDGDGAMTNDADDILEQGISLIRQAFAAEGRRAIDEFVAGLQNAQSGQRNESASKRVTRHPQAEKSARAPAGSARVLCKRALAEAKNNGLTVMKIHDKAEGEYENMLSISAVRNELAVGEHLNPPLYQHVGGVWYLNEYAPPTMRVVGS